MVGIDPKENKDNAFFLGGGGVWGRGRGGLPKPRLRYDGARTMSTGKVMHQKNRE